MKLSTKFCVSCLKYNVPVSEYDDCQPEEFQNKRILEFIKHVYPDLTPLFKSAPYELCVQCKTVLRSSYVFKTILTNGLLKYSNYLDLECLTNKTLVSSDPAIPSVDIGCKLQKESKIIEECFQIPEYNTPIVGAGITTNIDKTNENSSECNEHGIKIENDNRCEGIETEFADELESIEHKITIESNIKCEDVEENSKIAQETNIKKSFGTALNDDSDSNELAIKLENDIKCEGFGTVFANESNEQEIKLQTDMKCENTLFDINPSIYNGDVIENESTNAQDNSENVFVVYYKCQFCDLCFTQNKYLEEHIKSKHEVPPLIQIAVSTKQSQAKPNTATFKCPLCNISFKTINTLEKHIKTHLAYKCDLCPKNFSNLYEKQEHETTHKFICIKCNMHFKNSDYLQLHQYLHQNSYYGPFKCKKCDKRFVNKNNRNLHQKSHDLTAAETLFTCDICLDGFETIAKYHAHKTEQHANEYKCKFCNECFVTRPSRNSHERLHHKTSTDRSKPITLRCEYCNKSVADENVSRRHKFKHTRKKPITCSRCRSTFVYKMKFKEHQQKVHNSRHPDFGCDRCPISFESKFALNKHKKSHLNLYNCAISCTVCKKSFATKHLLNQHMANQHRQLVK